MGHKHKHLCVIKIAIMDQQRACNSAYLKALSRLTGDSFETLLRDYRHVIILDLSTNTSKHQMLLFIEFGPIRKTPVT